jgi:hypothetical protein
MLRQPGQLLITNPATQNTRNCMAEHPAYLQTKSAQNGGYARGP